jgi:hypothetical protein
MLALKITDIKDFTNKLFIGEVFDRFRLSEAVITTFAVFTIDGTLQQDFFDSDEKEILVQKHRTHALWKDIKSYCFSIIRGKRTPLSFKIVLLLPPTALSSAAGNLSSFSADIGSLYLNIQYRNGQLLCTTGVSLKTFIPGLKPDALWDGQILDFFHKHLIQFEEI